MKSPNDDTDSIPNWQEYAYDRLKVLYRTGKLLAASEDIEKTFPLILTSFAYTFPFLSAVLIRKKGEGVSASIWTSEAADQSTIDRSVRHAKDSYIYLTGASASDAAALRVAEPEAGVLKGVRVIADPEWSRGENFFALPLAVDHQATFGILQFEGAEPLTEDDLEFAGALADLFAIAIDRYQKIQSERRRLEIETEASAARLSSSESYVTELESERELREKFVSLLTHDLRTPLSAIRLNAQMIQIRASSGAEKVNLLAGRVISSVDRADQMITDLLDANRIQGGEKLPISVKPVELVSLVKTTLDELSVIHGDRFVLKGDPIVSGFWDPRALRRIVENLCNNAVKYGSDKRPVSVSVFTRREAVYIKVQNFGNPISPGDQKFLFRQFHRSKKAQDGAKRGWGIGLTLVEGVAVAHDGNVSVESDAETGTVFTVVLPIDSRSIIPTARGSEIGLRNELGNRPDAGRANGSDA